MGLGSGIGAIAGTAISGGNPMGGMIGSTLGGLIEGGIKGNKAKNINIPLNDPTQINYLNSLLLKQKALESGTAYQSQQDAIRLAGKEAMDIAGRQAGGDYGAMVSALKNINRSTGRNLNELFGTMGLEALKMSSLIGEQTNLNAQRRLDIPMMEKSKLEGDAAQVQKDAMANLQGLLARNPFGRYSTPEDVAKPWESNYKSEYYSNPNANAMDNTSMGTPINLNTNNSVWNMDFNSSRTPTVSDALPKLNYGLDTSTMGTPIRL